MGSSFLYLFFYFYISQSIDVSAINKDLNNIFEEGELSREAIVSILEIVQSEDTSSYCAEIKCCPSQTVNGTFL